MTPPSSNVFRRMQDVGNAVFPSYNLQARLYTPPSGASPLPRHSQRSQIVWLDNLRFAFLDHERGATSASDTMSLVVVNLYSGAVNPEVRQATLNLGSLVNANRLPPNYQGRPADVVYADKIEVTSMTATSYDLKVTFVGNSALNMSSVIVHL